LDAVAVLNVRRSINAPPVYKCPVAAVKIREHEAIRIGRVPADPGVVTAHQVLAVDVESDLSGCLSPDQDLAETLEGNFFHLIGLRPIQVTNNDIWHDKVSFCQVERSASPVTGYTRDAAVVLRKFLSNLLAPIFCAGVLWNCAIRYERRKTPRIGPRRPGVAWAQAIQE
jgi:hypothetical protein